MRKVIRAYCLDWHIGSSNAFIDLLVEPLKDKFDIRLTSWNGKSIDSINTNDLVIFCMLPPTDDILHTHKKVIWIPMWDQAQGYDQLWWNQLPKHLNIISFSDAISQRAITAGLNILDVRYAVDPNSVEPANWDNGVVISYWNRVGLVGPDFLKKLCRLVGAKKLIFRPKIDPRIEKHMYYELPDRIGSCEVVTIDPKSKEGYLDKTAESNILIAPRKAEGVGLIFLEAMARGCTVIAYDAPTMNEYIVDGQNGFLFDGNMIAKWKNIFNVQQPSDHYLFSGSFVPKNISGSNLRTVGKNAKNSSERLFLEWQKSIPKLTEFISSSEQ